MKHKHAELIHAWCEGAEIQYKSKVDGEWCDHSDTEWDEDYEYRIKPKPSRAFKDIPIRNIYILRFYPSDTGWMCDISNEMMDAIQEIYK